VITTERQLRNILGLPASDHRRIVPSTAPTEAKVEPDWEISLREMTESQPDIAQQNLVVRLTELQLLLARNQLLPLMSRDGLHQFVNLGPALDAITPALAASIRQTEARPQAAGLDPSKPREPEFIAGQVGLTAQTIVGFRTPLVNARQAQYQLLRQRATLQQITHQATNSMARFFVEIDANYKQYQTAQRLRNAAQQRLEAQRAFYAEGRVTIDRLLDAVGQYANAIDQESQYKCTYNTAIVALEEAKGTLLAYDKIQVAEAPRPRKPDAPAKVDTVVPVAFETPSEVAPAANPQPAPMTYKIKARFGGLKFLEIEVEVGPASSTPPGH
jgi:outer membrane protein TolC